MNALIFKSFLPEIFLSFCILMQLVFNAKLINTIKFNFPVLEKEIFSQIFFILFCLLLLFLNLKIEGSFSNSLFLNDEGGRCIKIILVVVCLASLVIIFNAFTFQTINFFEFFSIFLFAILSLLLLVSTYDLLAAYLVIEMQALSFYTLASFRRNSAFSAEAGLKYFISGAFMSCIFLFGSSLIYGSLGTLNFSHLEVLLALPLVDEFEFIHIMASVGAVLIAVSLLFKVSAAPFHFWAPDVYEGSPLSSTVIFSIIPKIIIFTFLLRWLSITSSLFLEINFILMATGLISVLVGTFFALNQKRLKRLVIYSSIAQVGFIVAALSLNSFAGISSVYFFLIIYIITSILVWGNIVSMYRFQKVFNKFYAKSASPIFISALSNLFKKNAIWGFSFIIIFFSISGIPPLSGFWAKVFILLEIINCGHILSALLLVLISGISVFYYIRIIKVVFFESRDATIKANKEQTIFYGFDGSYFIFALCLFLLVFLFFYPTTLLLLCQYIFLNFTGC